MPLYLASDALHIAAGFGRIHMVDQLLQSVPPPDIDVIDNCGSSPLIIAAAYKHFDVMTMLLQRSANVTLRDRGGYAALHAVSRSGYANKNIAAELVNRGANIEARSNDSLTPLYMAAMTGSIEMISFLIECGANIEAMSIYGFTPLSIAVLKGRSDAVRLLLAKGANIETADDKDRTLIHWAALRDHVELIPLFVQLPNGRQLLDRVDSKSGTPLHTAIWKGNLNAAHKLLDEGAEVNVADEFGITPVHEALFRGHFSFAQELVELFGANPRRVAKDGTTVLHRLAQRGGAEHIQMLLSWDGIEPWASDYMGHSALQKAILLNNVKFVKEFTKAVSASHLLQGKAHDDTPGKIISCTNHQRSPPLIQRFCMCSQPSLEGRANSSTIPLNQSILGSI